jgi:formylglycine-generating enzyme required for sulfatase activity
LWIGKCEVTWDEYDLFTQEKLDEKAKGRAAGEPVDVDAITRPTPPYIDETWQFGRTGYPVIAITHHAAMEYCRWLSRKTGRAYRLPTEAEWEWAARAGTQAAYFFGDDAAKLCEYAWFADNSDEKTHPVGKKKPNPWGLHDIYGNANEWCLDQYRKDFYARLPLRQPSLGPVLLPTGSRWPHVVRGGSWDEPAPRCRSAARRGSEPKWQSLDSQRPMSIWWLTCPEFGGFRVVRAVEEQENLKGIRSLVTRDSK